MSAHRAPVGRVPPRGAPPSGRKKAVGDRSSAIGDSAKPPAALGYEAQNTPSPEGAKAGDELPNGWTQSRIEDLFSPLEDGRTLHQGWSPQCHKGPSTSEDIWGVLKTTAIQAGEFQPEYNKLLPSGLEPRPLIEVAEGDILITCAGPRVRCGVSCLVRQTRKRLMMSGKMYRFRVDPDRTDPRYVEAFLQTERARLAIDKMKTGSSDSGLNLTHDRFRQLSIPVAPLPEQHRIVAEIEKQFTRLEAAVAALRRVQASLKRYRAAVLKAACEGKLVPTEAELARVGRVPPRGARPNAKNAASGDDGNAASGDAAYNAAPFETGEQLLQRILAERRKNWTGRGKYKEPAGPDIANLPRLPGGWTVASIDQLAVATMIGLDRGRAQQSDNPTSGLPYIKMNNVTMDGRVFCDDLVYVPVSREEATRFAVEDGDILFNTRNSKELVGKVGLVRSPPAGSIYNNNLMRIRLAGGVLPAFLALQMCSHGFRRRMELVKKATTNVAAVYAKDLLPLAIALPPLAEQTRIVAEVERRLSVVEELEAVVSANFQRAARLRQAILQAAFTEKWTPFFGPRNAEFKLVFRVC